MDIELKQIDGKIIQIYSEEFKRKVIDEYFFPDESPPNLYFRPSGV